VTFERQIEWFDVRVQAKARDLAYQHNLPRCASAKDYGYETALYAMATWIIMSSYVVVPFVAVFINCLTE
jgi:hypothetical protein